MALELLHVANPMCSWCWGFASVIAGVAERHADAARVTLALGSLGRGDRPMRLYTLSSHSFELPNHQPKPLKS